MARAGRGIAHVALIIASLGILVAPVQAQSSSPQASSDKQGRVAQTPKLVENPSVSEDVIVEDDVVVPPAPLVMRRKPNVITIPVGDPPELDEAESELAYEEQPVASSNLRIGSTYGYRRDPFTRRARFHSGLDIKARWGQPVGASHPGIVQFAGWYYGYGNLLIVDHGGGVTTYYAHLASFELGVGDKVTRGAIVGYAGSTGRATSPHLHYEVRFEGNSVDPLQPLALDPSSGYFSRDDAPSARTSQDEKK